jgi:hypothetical protein
VCKRMNRIIKSVVSVCFVFRGQPWTRSYGMEIDSKGKSVKDLDAYALERWEAILHYLVEKQQKLDSVSRDTITTLTHADLM